VPNRGEQVVATDDAISRANEKFQKVEDLRFDRNHDIATPQLTALDVEHEIFGTVDQTGPAFGAPLPQGSLTQLIYRKNQDNLRRKSAPSQSAFPAISACLWASRPPMPGQTADQGD
jgi:hypothetical protein